MKAALWGTIVAMITATAVFADMEPQTIRGNVWIDYSHQGWVITVDRAELGAPERCRSRATRSI